MWLINMIWIQWFMYLDNSDCSLVLALHVFLIFFLIYGDCT